MDCKPQLGGYVFSGKPATTILSPGDESEIMLTFYSKQEYKIVVCMQPLLAAATFEVVDMEDNSIFDSKQTKANSFEFKMGATQQLKVKIHIPEAKNMVDNYDMACLSVLVGIKH